MPSYLCHRGRTASPRKRPASYEHKNKKKGTVRGPGRALLQQHTLHTQINLFQTHACVWLSPFLPPPRGLCSIYVHLFHSRQGYVKTTKLFSRGEGGGECPRKCITFCDPGKMFRFNVAVGGISSGRGMCSECPSSLNEFYRTGVFNVLTVHSQLINHMLWSLLITSLLIYGCEEDDCTFRKQALILNFRRFSSVFISRMRQKSLDL